MGQEFTIKSTAIENKINQLLPSQGGFQPGVDFSASTMVIPIVDLTETAEGSSLRLDLQKALSFTTANAFDVNATTSTIITTTGYWRVTGSSSVFSFTGDARENLLIINDGTTDKTVWSHGVATVDSMTTILNVDLILFLSAGDSIKVKADTSGRFSGSIRQIASLAGDLVNP